jgi:hypothetical protein
MSLDDLVKEVQRKIGRNILLFQKLEYLFKYIVANGQFSGYSSEIESVVTSKRASVNKQTMGQLVGQFVESNNPERNDLSNHPSVLKEAYYSFDFQIETDESYYKHQKESLSKLVLERNNLVHHLLAEFDSTSLDSCKKTERSLDEQAEKVRAELNSVQSTAKALFDGREEMSKFLLSDEGKKVFLLSFIRQDPLVVLLVEIANQIVRKDGWTLMNAAGLLVKQHAPDALALLHKGTEYKSLKSLMLKSEMFEFNEEKTVKGGIRVLYRLKGDLELSHA